MVGIIVDIIAVLVILIAAFVAYKKGFVSTVFGLLSAILAFSLAFALYKNVALYINENTGIDEFLNEKISNIEIPKLQNEEIKDDDSTSKNYIPDVITELVNVDELKQNTMNAVASKLTNVVINVLAWLIVYSVVRIVSSIVMYILNTIMKLPLLKEINNMAGLVIGAVMGFFRIYLLLLIIYFISNIVEITFVLDGINASTLVSGMYHNNLLLNLF